MHKYRAALLMMGLALVFMVIHLYSGWQAEIEDAATHGQAAEVGAYLVQWTRDTAENLQSEFWQLAVQFALLAGFFEFLRVRAYEEDNEQMDRRLDTIERMLKESRWTPDRS